VLQADAERTERTVRGAFAAELRDGQIQNVDVLRACSILSVVGDGMAGTPGIAAKVFAALAGAGVNVRAIAQGSSERNISVVIDEKHSTRALRAVHAAFYLSPHTVSIGVVGPGVVGGTLLDQVWSQVPRPSRLQSDLRVRGIMSSNACCSPVPQAPGMRREDLAAALPVDPRVQARAGGPHPHARSSSIARPAPMSPRCIRGGWPRIHVVTLNKRANSGVELRRQVQAPGGAHIALGHQGAGLLIMQTLRDLRETGDEIRRSRASSRDATICSTWTAASRFLHRPRGQAKGYTEPIRATPVGH
jgi:aspartokinase/homoserine dehydrogenase 1